jgi:hypothetical protein
VQQGTKELELWQNAEAREQLIKTLGDLETRACPDGVYIVKLHDPGDKETISQAGKIFNAQEVQLSEANTGRNCLKQVR